MPRGMFWAILFGMVGAAQLQAAEPSRTKAETTTAAVPVIVKQESLARKLEAKMADLKIPGAVVGIYQASKPVAKLSLGYADVSAKRPMTSDLYFRVASISKPCVGTVILQLVDEGKLALDDPVDKYLEGVPGGNKLTIRHLGTMRAGVFNYIESKTVKQMFAQEPERLWKPTELLSAAYQGKAYFEPGAGFHYANTNFLILGQIAEKITGKSIEELVSERVCKPLEMKHSFLAVDNKIPEPHPRGYSWGTDDGPFFNRGEKLTDVTATSPSWWGCAGSMISNLEDLAKLAKPMATGGLVSARSFAEQTKWLAMDDKHADPSGVEKYGFAIEMSELGIGHDGDVPGFQSTMRYFPEYDTTLIVLTNLYGWSIRTNPASHLAGIVKAECWPDARKPAPIVIPDEG
jgi:D-alanyl-D-alanine carboxypeptidase